jgi:hypothetical protein
MEPKSVGVKMKVVIAGGWYSFSPKASRLMEQNTFWTLALTATRLPAAIAQQYVYPARRQSLQQQASYG